MATPVLPASVVLYEAARVLGVKGRFARAAEKLGAAVAAAAQELAAEDCLVVAYLQAVQAGILLCHSFAPNLSAADIEEAHETTKSVLLPQCMLTLARRKAAGTLLPGSCRTAEVTWFRASLEVKLLQEGALVEVARASAGALAPTLGFDACMHTAKVALDSLMFSALNMSREMQLSQAAVVASAFELMAQPHELTSIVLDGAKIGVLPSLPEEMLAEMALGTLVNRDASTLDGEALSLMLDAWRRVERSGAIKIRKLGLALDPETSIDASFDAAAAEAAVHGLRKCALAGCAAKEVHVSQFKRCGACRTVSFCCREHQVADWPAHKAACKAAARKAGGTASKS